MLFPFMSRSRQGRFRSALLVALALVPAAAVAQTTITTSTTGPIYGNDNSIDVTSSGVIFNPSGIGVISTGTNTTTTLTNSGSIAAFSYGVLNQATGSFNTITNAGWISGGRGLSTSGTIGTFENQAGGSLVGDGYGFVADGSGVGSLQNAGSITGYNAVVIANATLGAFTNSGTAASSGGVGFGLQGTGSVGTFTNSGLINGATGVGLGAGTSVLTLANSGTISGDNGMTGAGTIGSVTNDAGGLIKGNGFRGVWQSGGSVGQFTNNGSVTAGTVGVLYDSGATLGTFANSGEITAGVRGISLSAGTTTTIDNSGSVSGGERGLEVAPGVTIGTLTNSGTFSGSFSVVIANTGTVSNTTTGLITATANDALYLQGGQTLTLLDNAGTISGPRTGFNGDVGSTVGSLTNSGTISGGNAVVVATSGTVTNAAGGLFNGTTGDGVYVRVGASSLAGLDNAGSITGLGRGVNISAGTTNSINNSGSIGGGYAGIESVVGSVIGTLTNTGTISGGVDGALLATTGTVTNAAGALISASANEGVYLRGGQTLTLLDNAGTISGVRNGFNGEGTSTVRTLTNTGTLSGGDSGAVLATTGTVTNAAGGLFNGTTLDGVYVRPGETLTLLDNAGTISGVRVGFNGDDGSTVGTLTNSGTISGGGNAVVVATSGTVTNAAGGLISGTVGEGVYLRGGHTLSLLDNAGTINAGGTGVYGVGGSTIGTLTNSGTIQAGGNGLNLSASGTVTNLAGALISATIGDAIVTTGAVQRIDNAGALTGGSSGIHTAAGSIGSISNTGSINSGGTNSSDAGIQIGSATSVDSIDNSGTINGQLYGIYASYYSNNLGTLTNSGTISGEYYGAFLGTTGTVTNAAGGLIRSNTTAGYGIQADSVTPIAIINSGTISGATGGVRMISSGTFTNQAGGVAEGVAEGAGAGFVSDGQVDLVDNAGLIRGDSAGVQVRFGTLLSLVNSGTVASTGASPKVAVHVGLDGTLGDASGVSGPAIVSTAAGALLDGGIVNAGRIANGFRIGNQDVTVSAGTEEDEGLGVFDGGTLEVVNGNLTFTDGRFQLDSDVSVNGGSGRFVNQATIELLANQTVTGNFEQTSAGTTLVDLLGLTPGSWGHLGITGTADFAGSLALDDSQLSGGINGGQAFELFSFASYTGGFSSLFMNGSALSSLGTGVWAYGGLTLTEIWTGTTMSLSVTGTAAVPEIDPASLGSALALVLGSLGMLERKRRRVIG